MAGRHRKTSRRGGRHRKPTSPARVILPTGTAVAVVVAVIVLHHVDAGGDGGAPTRIATPPPTVSHKPPPSVLAFSTTRAKPVITSTPRLSPTPEHRRHHQPAHRHRDVQHHRHKQPTPATIRLVATADCYVQVTSRHGHVLTQRILHRHDHVAFHKHGLHVVLGNAGGVRIAVHGHHSHRAGRSGHVRRFRVS